MAREAVRDKTAGLKRSVRSPLVLDSVHSHCVPERVATDSLSPSVLFPLKTFVSPRSAHPSLRVQRNKAFAPVLAKTGGQSSLPNLAAGSRVMGQHSSLVAKDPPAHPVRIAAKSQTGMIDGYEKANNQDTCFTAETKGWRVMGVCDGHGVLGHHVSAYLRTFFPRYTLDALIEGNGALEEAVAALRSAFHRCSVGMRESVLDCMNSGSTCVSVLWRSDTLLCGNVGDSRAVVGKFSNGSWSAEPLSIDHKPDAKSERSRIEAAGGEVCVSKLVHAGPARVYVKGEHYPGLAMSRSMGDEVAKTIGVTSEPDISVTSLTEAHKFVIVASDGVWEFIPNIEAVRIVALHWESEDAIKAVTALVRAAQYRWSVSDSMMDDITAAVAFFR